MSKQLLVMRHAKSSWAAQGLSDFERPLNKRGLRVTPHVARFIHSQGLTPDLVVSSSATRAKMTAEIFVEHCDSDSTPELQLLESFYHAPSSVYLDFLKRFADEAVNTLMFVGHNPGLEDLVQRLSGQWDAMPTAAIAHFDLSADRWSEVGSPPNATLSNLWRPKELGIK